MGAMLFSHFAAHNALLLYAQIGAFDRYTTEGTWPIITLYLMQGDPVMDLLMSLRSDVQGLRYEVQYLGGKMVSIKERLKKRRKVDLHAMNLCPVIMNALVFFSYRQLLTLLHLNSLDLYNRKTAVCSPSLPPSLLLVSILYVWSSYRNLSG